MLPTLPLCQLAHSYCLPKADLKKFLGLLRAPQNDGDPTILRKSPAARARRSAFLHASSKATQLCKAALLIVNAHLGPNSLGVS